MSWQDSVQRLKARMEGVEAGLVRQKLTPRHRRDIRLLDFKRMIQSVGLRRALSSTRDFLAVMRASRRPALIEYAMAWWERAAITKRFARLGWFRDTDNENRRG